MSGHQEKTAGRGLVALLALPVLCCIGHALLLAAGFGTLTALVGGVAGSIGLVAAGLLFAAGAAVLLRGRMGARREPGHPPVPARVHCRR